MRTHETIHTQTCKCIKLINMVMCRAAHWLGNQTEKDKVGSDEKWTYVFDNKNRLTQARHYDNSNALVLQASYKYDVFGWVT